MLTKFLSNNAENTYKWLVTILTGAFVFVVLYIYRAYHVDEVTAYSGHTMLFRALTHSLITSLIFYLVEFHLSKIIHVRDNIKPVILILIATFTGLNMAFLAFNYFFQWTELHWNSYSQFLYEYPLIIAFPVLLSFLIKKVLKQSKPGAEELIKIVSDNKKEKFQIKADNLLYIKSADNYIEINYLLPQKMVKHLIRKNLKDLEQEFDGSPYLIRCHRSYLINPNRVDLVNKQNNKIELSINGVHIPVSKTYLDSLVDKFPI